MCSKNKVFISYYLRAVPNPGLETLSTNNFIRNYRIVFKYFLRGTLENLIFGSSCETAVEFQMGFCTVFKDVLQLELPTEMQ